MIYQQLMCKLLSKIQICIYLFVIYKSTWLRNCTMHSLIGYFQGEKRHWFGFWPFDVSFGSSFVC